MLASAIQNEIKVYWKNAIVYSLISIPAGLLFLLLMDKPDMYITAFALTAATQSMLFYLNSYLLKENRERLLALRPLSNTTLFLFRHISSGLVVIVSFSIYFLVLVVFSLLTQTFNLPGMIWSLGNTGLCILVFSSWLVCLNNSQKILYERFPGLVGGILQGILAIVISLVAGFVASISLGYEPVRSFLAYLFRSIWFIPLALVVFLTFFALDWILFIFRRSFDDPKKGFLLIWATDKKSAK